MHRDTMRFNAKAPREMTSNARRLKCYDIIFEETTSLLNV